MKKLLLLSLITLSILVLSACSSGGSQEEYDKLLTENASLKEEIKGLQSEVPSITEESEQISEPSSNIEETSWDFIVNNYPLVTYDEIKAGNYSNQYVILPATIDTAEYSELMNWVTCNVWFNHENSYVCDHITIQCDKLPNYSPQSLQSGDNIDICFFINVDNSFGFTIKGFSKNESSTSLEDIYTSFKQNCSPIDWESIMRNPDNFHGTTYSFTGNIFQIVSTQDNHAELLLSVNNNEYIHVSYTYKNGDLKFLENDTLTVYGTFYKLYEYTSVLGTNQSIPSIVAEFIDIN